MVKKILVNWNLSHKGTLICDDIKKDKVIALIQARTTSTRFPNKIYQDLNGCPVIYHVIDRAKMSKMIDKTIVISPTILEDLPEDIENFVYKEDENDVLSRFYWASKQYPADYFVRLTADCPLLDPYLIDFIIKQALEYSADYCSNVMSRSFPDGVDTEVLSKNCLSLLHQTIHSPYYREHVTLLLRENKAFQDELNCVSIENQTDLSKIKLSIDEKEDLDRLRQLEDLKWKR